MSRSFSFKRAIFALAVGAICLVALPGCGSKVNDANYAKIKQGMTEAEVENIMGKPTSTESSNGLISGSKKEWKDGDKTILVAFVDGKVFAMDKKGF